MSAPLMPTLSKPDPKWTYDDFVRRISLLEAQVKVLENRSLEDELERAQHREAFCQMHAALSIALTSAPVKFTAAEKKAWEGGK